MCDWHLDGMPSRKLWDGLCTKEFLPLSLIAIENVQIALGGDAPHVTVTRKLPDVQVYVWLVFAIAGNPEVVVLFQVGSQVEISVYKALVDVE